MAELPAATAAALLSVDPANEDKSNFENLAGELQTAAGVATRLGDDGVIMPLLDVAVGNTVMENGNEEGACVRTGAGVLEPQDTLVDAALLTTMSAVTGGGRVVDTKLKRPVTGS